MSEAKKIEKILIVDDDPVQITLLKGILSENNYEVISADEASVGLQMAMTNNPDLILLDVMMPVINGYNFCKLLKAEESQKNILVILVTSRDNVEDVKIGLAMGANAYLTKPVNTKELLKTIKDLETAL